MGQITNNSSHRVVIFDPVVKARRTVCEPMDFDGEGAPIADSNVTDVPDDEIRAWKKTATGLDLIAAGKVVARLGEKPKPKKGSFEAMGPDDQMAFVELETDIEKLTDILSKPQSDAVKNALIQRITALAKSSKG